MGKLANKNRKVVALSVFVFLLLVVFLLIAIPYSLQKLTHIERDSVSDVPESLLELDSENPVIEQSFCNSFDILHGFEIFVDHMGNDTGLSCTVSVFEKESGKEVAEKVFDATSFCDGDFCRFKLDKNCRIHAATEYVLRIKNTGNVPFAVGCYLEPVTGVEKLSVSVFGGNTDYWWLGMVLLLGLVLLALGVRLLVVAFRGQNPLKDSTFMAILLGLLVFAILCVFARAASFLDENDNVEGGMVIAKGGVLYKDYVVQHTPIAYYVCGLFAFLGAGSTMQFRLSFYFLEAVLWSILFLRHKEKIGAGKMFLLAVAEAIVMPCILYSRGALILYDSMQGFCLVALLLEYYGYLKDKSLGWSRSIAVSLCIWGSIGNAFVSVYAIVWVFLAVFIGELLFWRKEKCSFGKIIKRYYKFVTALLVPLLIFFAYFGISGGLKRAIDQIYLFNREVYPKYTGYGDNLFKPFAEAVTSLAEIVITPVKQVIGQTADRVIILQWLSVILVLILFIGLCIKKRFAEAIPSFLVLICSATRGYYLHGMPAYIIAVLFIVYFADVLGIRKYWLPRIVLGLCSLFLLYVYAKGFMKCFRIEQQPVSLVDSQIIELTEAGEKIFIDERASDPMYCMYKDRYPVNRLVYMLPWYLDWYEQDCIEDLLINKPKVAVYWEACETNGMTYYANDFLAVIKEHYTRISADDIDCRIWLRNEE